MSEKLDTILPKITLLLLRTLSSTFEGEISNSVRAIQRALAGAGSDIHELVERLKNKSISAAEVQKIYDKGFADGRAKGVTEGRRSALVAVTPLSINGVGDGVNGYPWMEIALHCAAQAHLFSGRERDFVEDMPGKLARYGAPTEPQAEWLGNIFRRRFSGRID